MGTAAAERSRPVGRRAPAARLAGCTAVTAHARDRLMLLDTPSLYFRAFFGVPDSITAPDGTPVNAVRGLLDFIARLVTRPHADPAGRRMDDDWRPAFRVDAIPSYKAHRVAADGGERRSPDALAAAGRR